MNGTNNGGIAAEENDLGKDILPSEERNQYDESEECNQSMEYTRI